MKRSLTGVRIPAAVSTTEPRRAICSARLYAWQGPDGICHGGRMVPVSHWECSIGTVRANHVQLVIKHTAEAWLSR